MTVAQPREKWPGEAASGWVRVSSITGDRQMERIPVVEIKQYEDGE